MNKTMKTKTKTKYLKLNIDKSKYTTIHITQQHVSSCAKPNNHKLNIDKNNYTQLYIVYSSITLHVECRCQVKRKELYM